tara:strand:- start:1995 stop:2486 length:492 start_codon:yes stop_codon:yes gene_type:complete
MSATDGLLPEEYQAVIAPAMQAAAELAAARGDPYLYNDLACMLALMVLVRDLADLYQDQWGPLGQHSPPDVFAAAPSAACVMVLSEYEIETDSIRQMTTALERAAEQLTADGVFGPERVEVHKAWKAFLEDKRDSAQAWMRQAASRIANAVDAWEARRAAASR